MSKIIGSALPDIPWEERPAGETMLFGQWLEQKEIPDPYRKSQDAFEHVYGMLERASQEWAKRLSR